MFAGHSKHGGGHGKDRGGEAGDLGEHKDDPSLENPRCVFQVLKKHFARYTPELVESSCGIPKEKFLEVAEVYTSASGPERTGAICYAVGWTQHSKGPQIIRAAAILQLLAGKHWPSRRRSDGAARPRHDSGIHGRSHSL